MAASHEKTSSELRKVLILKPPNVFLVHENLFCQRFHFVKAWESPLPTNQFLSTYAQSIEALFCSSLTCITADILSLLPTLRLVVTSSVGVDHIDLNECRRRGIKVANTAEVFTDDVADIAVGLLIDVLRKISAADKFVRAGLWSSEFPLGYKLGGKRVGIVGLGSIGLQVAKRLEAFGCIVSYNSRTKKPSVSFPHYADPRELALNSDVLVICCALTDQTYHMINKEVLSALGKQGFIVNVARGAIVDEKELVRCLVQGEIAGAGLEVFADEPNVPDVLLELNNVVLSPHRGVYTEESFWDSYELISGNLESFFCNKPLLTPVLDE
ncbi:Glyoxylate/hydroxypyruvate reductase HPR3 [Heracleum sosnowskyi]|uniref:Glyoxylate/hydroxypyruvate reductase HPR3 n=1 Tax=Heracleum sosnowskyi TaxID=360622 RepID=A0AAD8M9D8_9APIA|nr:Glyoxylate/hydroxypyruvate reductase HPR3 [Heracleum sosnowskyi]